MFSFLKGKPSVTPATLRAKIASIKERILNTPPEAQSVHVITRASRRKFEAHKAQIIAIATAAPVDVFNVHNAISATHSLTDNDRFVSAHAVLQVLETSTEYQEAAKVLDPLFTELAAAEAELHTLNVQVATTRHELRQAEKAARAKAFEAAENTPELVAARESLAALNEAVGER